MRALLLAAGLGTRLQPLTGVLPKCLAPIRGRPLLEFWLELLFSANAERVVVNTHHHAEMVDAYARGTPWREKIVVANELQLLGTGGTILRQQAHFASAPFLVAHADNLSVFDCGSLMRWHALRPPKCAMTMMTFTTRSPESSGIVALDDRGVVHAFHEKVASPHGNLANAAVYVLEPEVLGFLHGLGKTFIDFSTEVIPRFLGRIFTFHNAAYHEDIGSLERWRRAQREYPGGLPAPLPRDPWSALLLQHPEVTRTVAALLPGEAALR